MKTYIQKLLPLFCITLCLMTCVSCGNDEKEDDPFVSPKEIVKPQMLLQYEKSDDNGWTVKLSVDNGGDPDMYIVVSYRLFKIPQDLPHCRVGMHDQNSKSIWPDPVSVNGTRQEYEIRIDSPNIKQYCDLVYRVDMFNKAGQSQTKLEEDWVPNW